jgi:ribonuclease P protein component
MTAPNGQGFPKAARIRRRREFLSLGRTGAKRRTESFVFVTQRCQGSARLGITVSRKVGGSVTRNHLKRRIREVFRRHPDRARFGQDVIAIAKVGAGALTTQAIQCELDAAIGRRHSVSIRPSSDRQ